MNALMPFTGMRSLRKEMDRLLERFGEPWGDWEALTEWAPALDVSENKDAIVVKAEVPGVDAKDLKVSLEGDLLTLAGEKKYEKEEKDERHHRIERSYGTFTRRIRLPAAVDAGRVTASFKNGLITITLPKTAAAKGTQISVKSE
jgi:HSP20 family protein